MRNWPGASVQDPLPQRLRACLVAAGRLEPKNLGLGRSLVGVLHSVSSLLPGRLADAAASATDPLWQVSPARVYAVTRGCGRAAQGRSAGLTRSLLLDRPIRSATANS